MRVVTAELMRALDGLAIASGVAGAVLMENAGRAVFELLAARYGPVRNRLFTVLCGTGNNGGDGLVVARYLHLAGARTCVRIAGNPGRIQGDAKTNLDLLRRLGVTVSSDAPVSGIKIDGLLGTGATGAPRDAVADAIRWMNADPNPTVAIDIPSGVDSDTGATAGEAVRAAATVTFVYPKLGILLVPGAECAGDIVVSDIGYRWGDLDVETPYRWITREDAAEMFPRRAADAHKGDFGHVLVVGGSRGMSGAPAMTAYAALRAGAGLVTAAVPEGIQPIVAAHRPEVMVCPVAEQDGSLCQASAESIVSLAKRATVVCLGPGMSLASGASALAAGLLRDLELPVVVDADGLQAVADHPEALVSRTAAVVLTPHPGECARLLGRDTASIQADRLGSAREAAKRYGAIVVLKGARTLIADGRAEPVKITVNTTGNPGMATAGSGDSLTGIIGALIGQGLEPYDAASLGAYIHGCAGDRAAQKRGQAGLIAGDIIEAIPEVIHELEGAV